MANDLATLRTRLARSLRDEAFATWTSAEIDELLIDACASMYPRVAIPKSLPVYPLVPDQEDYPLPTGIREVSSVDLCQVSTDTLLHPLMPGSWRTYGDTLGGNGMLGVNGRYSDVAWYFVVHGYGIYDLTTELPPQQYVPYILATAGAEAVRRMLSDRARYVKWQAHNQKENVTVNELAQMVNVFETKAERELAKIKTWRRPTAGR